MSKPINILVVEDSLDDADLLMAELRRAGFAPTSKRVETEADFLAELKASLDVIISDYSMPQFSGLRALELLNQSGLDIPFILVSGTVGEDAAVEAMKRGAMDYLLKDRIGRMGNAIERALEQKRLRAKNWRDEQQIHLQASALEAAANAILITDTQGKILFANAAACTMTGYTSEEMLGQNPRFLKSGKHHPDFFRDLWSTILAGRVWSGEMVNRRKDGTFYPEAMTITPVRASGNKITHFISVKQDITARKQAEEELRGKTMFLEAQVNSSPDGILVVDERNKRILQNQRIIELFQVPQQIAEDDDDTPLLRHVTGQMKNPQAFLKRVEHLYAHPDEVGRDEIELTNGTILDRYSSPVRDKDGKYYGRIWAFRDITERRKLEEQFRQSQKMDAIGQLAGGVAHDFNNLLAVIQMNCDLLKAEQPLPASHLELAEGISAATQRASALIRQLLLFSRKETMQPRDLDLNQSIGGMSRMLQRMLGENIRVEFKFSPQPLFIHADPGMIDQVLMNLVVNSRDAMPKGGKLVVETYALELDDLAAAQMANARPGSFVCLSVSDTGCGIPVENLPRIFEPFFTTKGIGKGTGLGLATVFGIVQQHQGWIHVDSDTGKGTTFRIFLPHLPKTKFQPLDDTVFKPLPVGTETILLVEDDPFLRTSVRKTLLRLSYRVLEAEDGIQALEVWKQHRHEIQLVLTDLIMPNGMTGKDLGERLLLDNPKLKIIYASGYSAEIANKDFSLQEGVNFLTKPFQSDKLAETIRAQLDQ